LRRFIYSLFFLYTQFSFLAENKKRIVDTARRKRASKLGMYQHEILWVLNIALDFGIWEIWGLDSFGFGFL
jgi:hypothetical protein